ncbi:hypothetical protein AB210_0981 [Acinetobacter baumannii AB210]|nr:hypothetical protein AB210_0981 [Acinetobacter baumannii AB210]
MQCPLTGTWVRRHPYNRLGVAIDLIPLPFGAFPL